MRWDRPGRCPCIAAGDGLVEGASVEQAGEGVVSSLEGALFCQSLEVADATGPLHGHARMGRESLEDLDVLGPEGLLVEGPVTHHQHVPGGARFAERSGEPVAGRGQRR